MNANVVTAKQTDASFGIDRVPVGQGFGIPRQLERHALTSSRPPCKTAWSASTPHHRLDFTWVFEFTEPPYLRLYPRSYPRSSANRKSTAEVICQPLRSTLIRKEIGSLSCHLIRCRPATSHHAKQSLNQKAPQPGRWLRRFGGFAG